MDHLVQREGWSKNYVSCYAGELNVICRPFRVSLLLFLESATCGGNAPQIIDLGLRIGLTLKLMMTSIFANDGILARFSKDGSHLDAPPPLRTPP